MSIANLALKHLCVVACLILLRPSVVLSADQTYFHIQVIDDSTGRGVPLVELETVNSVVHITDNAGNIAFHEPGLMDQTVFFHVRSHGYEYPKDGFGFRGTRLDVKPGGKATLKIKRINIAERLYRATGQGRYRDSVLLGESVPVKEPLLNAQVVGSDSVINGILGGRLHWFWGDTNRPSYPLGNFQVPGATSRLPGDGGLDPGVGIDLEYFKDADGFAKQTAKMPGPGPTWIFGAGVVKDTAGNDALVAGYMKVEPPLKVYARGAVKFNEKASEFEQLIEFPKIPTLFPEGQTFLHRENEIDFLYFCKPFPHVRVRATLDAFRDPLQYEAFTCLKQGSTADKPDVERDAQGAVHYGWKPNTAAIDAALQKKLVAAGQLKPKEGMLRLRDFDTGKAITGHTGSVNWNAYRQRWVMVFVEHYGTSLLGEMWYAEADHPLGPWEYAVKIMTHDKYSFYNPKQHPYFDQQDGRMIYFEGTYTQMFSGNPVATPRYEYNQMMYRLDLADARLALPVPVYQTKRGGPFQMKGKGSVPGSESMQFLALDRPGGNTIAIYASESAGSDGLRLTTQPPADSIRAHPLFYALQHDLKTRPATVTPLYEYIHQDSKRFEYSIHSNEVKPGFNRSESPICLVWKP